MVKTTRFLFATRQLLPAVAQCFSTHVRVCIYIIVTISPYVYPFTLFHLFTCSLNKKKRKYFSISHSCWMTTFPLCECNEFSGDTNFLPIDLLPCGNDFCCCIVFFFFWFLLWVKFGWLLGFQATLKPTLCLYVCYVSMVKMAI